LGKMCLFFLCFFCVFSLFPPHDELWCFVRHGMKCVQYRCDVHTHPTFCNVM
jgi:hypothetical protein